MKAKQKTSYDIHFNRRIYDDYSLAYEVMVIDPNGLVECATITGNLNEADEYLQERVKEHKELNHPIRIIHT